MSENQIRPDKKNQPIKILYIVTQSEWGGAQTYVFDLAYYFSKNNWQVNVAVGEDRNGELIKRLEKINAGIFFMNNLKRKINMWSDINSFFDIIKLCRKIKPDIVHLNSSKSGAMGAIAARIAGIKKILYTVHGFVLNEDLSFFKKMFYLAAERISAKFKNHFICVSEFDKKSLLKHKICRTDKITVIYNGIDLENIKFLAQDEARIKLNDLIPDRGLSMTDYYIGTIAHLYKNKGLIYLIEAARETIEVEPRAKFLIIGEGEEKKRLEKLIDDYKLNENVYLLGNVFNASQYLKAFDIYVLASIKEGLSYSLIEAQTAGIPSVATAVGGSPEIVENNKTGVLVAAKNFNKLGIEIINLIQNKGKREELTKNSVENAKKFALKRMIEETEKIYNLKA